jgi:hypothetical protein
VDLLKGGKLAVPDALARAVELAWYDGLRTGLFAGVLAGLLLGAVVTHHLMTRRP